MGENTVTVPHSKGRTETETVCEKTAENFWTSAKVKKHVNGDNYMSWNFIIRTLRLLLLGRLNER
jgi:hypothetical protein